jgi:hypothetical protein
MPSTLSLTDTLIRDFPQFSFKNDTDFLWSPDTAVIHIVPSDPHYEVFMLHELSHALLHHQGYDRDINLLKLERDAWHHATSVLGVQYGVDIKDDFVQDNLDTYRDWLHARSTCPHCKAVGLQTKRQLYSCPACTHEWRVNEARMCALRRYTTT